LVPAVVLCALGVVMIVLGGCFLVGVMLVLFRDSPAPVSSLQYNYGDSFIVALYACAGVCFLVAAILLWVGIRRLMMWID
jgi:hypothetical protein